MIEMSNQYILGDLGDLAVKGFFRFRVSSVTRTAEELSVVCAEDVVPARVTCERGWRCLRIRGPLAFSEIGVLSCLALPLGRAGISIFVVSTYATDNILVKEELLGAAQAVLAAEGHTIES